VNSAVPDATPAPPLVDDPLEALALGLLGAAELPWLPHAVSSVSAASAAVAIERMKV
jgi:hypothetical protein